MAGCTGYGNCHQGRAPCKTAWACKVKTTDGGETVDNGTPISTQQPSPLSLRGAVWIGSAVLCGLAWAAMGWLL